MLDLTFGEQVKIILKRKGMTIKELAKLIEEQTGKKMSRQNMTQRLNRDNFQEQDMRTIASILGCPFQLNILGEDTAAENDSMEHIQEVAAKPEKEIVEETVEEVYEEPEEEVYEEPTKEVYEESEEEVYEEPTEERFYEEEPVEEVTEEIYEEPVEEPVGEPVEEYDDFRETEELIRETFEEENRKEVSEVTTGEAEETTSEPEEPESTAEDEEPTAKSEEPVKKKKHHSWKDYFQRMTGKHADKEAEGVKQTEVEEQKQQPEQEPSPKQEPVPEPEEEYKEELGEEFTEPEAEVSPVEEEFAEAFEEAVAKENEQEEETEDLSIGEMNPYTGREYESNSVRMHPKRIGYVQVYSRKDHKWQDMTEWAFLGEQERKKVELGDDYVSPIYLD